MVVARIVRPHGLDGALRMRSYSDNPRRFQPGGLLTAGGGEHCIRSCHPLPDGHAILRLEGIHGVATARALAGEWVYAAADTAPELAAGEYYHYQLVGLTVITDAGETLGEIREVLATGSNDVYVVDAADGSEILLPAIEQVVREVNLSDGRMLVHLIGGLR